MQDSRSDDPERPFPGEYEDAKQEIEDLEYGDRLDRAVEVLGGEVPEDFGPEEALDRSKDLVYPKSSQHTTRREKGYSDVDVHAAAVRMIRRAQWFLMSFPMIALWPQKARL